MKYDIYSRAEKINFIREYVASKEKLTKFCRLRGLSPSSFKLWMQKIELPQSELHKNQRILIISDTQFPFEHKATFDFLSALQAEFDFTRVIQIGDLIDNYRGSRFEQCPDMPSAAEELHQARLKCQRLQRLFPVMDVIVGNHDIRYLKKAKGAGIPKGAMVDFQTLLQLEDGWTFHHELVLDLPNGSKVMFHHGKSANVKNNAMAQGINFVQGHHHTKFVIDYLQQRDRKLFGMTVGCMIDDTKEPFSYNDTNKELPVLGCAGIINNRPILFPLNENLND